jgi:hypothetical protein
MKGLSIGLDANLLLLLVVGLAGESIITRHKRLQKYNVSTFKKLTEILSRSSNVIVTPHVLTETSNLMLFGLLEPDKSNVQQSFSMIAKRLNEHWVACEQILELPELRWLDLADCAWLSVLDIETILLTDDAKLSAAAHARNLKALSLDQMNF